MGKSRKRPISTGSFISSVIIIYRNTMVHFSVKYMYETLTNHHCCTIYFSIRKRSSKIIYWSYDYTLKTYIPICSYIDKKNIIILILCTKILLNMEYFQNIIVCIINNFLLIRYNIFELI